MVCVVFFDSAQRFLQLQHSRKFVLAAAAAKAGADKAADRTVPVFELNLVCRAAFNDGVAFAAVKADVSDPVLRVVVVPALCDAGAYIHSPQVIQTECGIIAAADERIVLLCRRLVPGDNLTARQRRSVERDEVAACHKKTTVDRSVRYCDHALVVGYFDFKIIADLGDAAAHTFQLAVHIDRIAAMQVKLVVVIGQIHIAFCKVHLYH